MNSKFLTFILLFILQTFIANGQDCKKLQDGLYSVKFKPSYNKVDFTIWVTGDKIKYLSEKATHGRIEWISDCYFRIHLQNDSQMNGKLDSLNYIQKALSTLGSGGTCYELLNEKNEFRETYCENLHITLSEGQLIKQ